MKVGITLSNVTNSGAIVKEPEKLNEVAPYIEGILRFKKNYLALPEVMCKAVPGKVRRKRRCFSGYIILKNTRFKLLP